MKAISALLLLALRHAVCAQSFVSPPRNVKTVLSKKFEGAKISYKKVANVCETTEGVSSYSGYVHLPSYFVPDAGGAKGLPKNGSASYYFWYFRMYFRFHNFSLVLRVSDDKSVRSGPKQSRKRSDSHVLRWRPRLQRI